MRKIRFYDYVPWSVAINLLIVYACYIVCRWIFYWENAEIIGHLTRAEAWNITKGGFLFDSSAIFYTNVLYLLMVLLPLHFKEGSVYRAIVKWVYVIVNSVCVVANLCDCVYFAYTMRRTTVLVFSEFAGNTNLPSIFGIEVINHWYLTLIGIALIWLLWKGYRPSMGRRQHERLGMYYVRYGVSLLAFGLLAVCGMRGGGFTTGSRPLTLSNANQYSSTPNQASVVINTPFSIFRTAVKRQMHIPQFFEDEAVMATLYNPVHQPDTARMVNKKNVVIFIMESFAEEFVGARNRDLDNGTYKGYTPFVDSLLQKSLTFEHTYSNGWLSIDAMPSILSSIPKFYTSFITSPYSLNDLPGIAKELDNWGYHSAFFHGAENSSMGFQAYARSVGFDEYYGRTEYEADSRFGGADDFDGTWAIWDEEFLQFFCQKMSEMPQPFITSVFTASSHHPFPMPERYKDVYPDEGKYPIHKCIRYSDNALRLFFETAKKQPWYDNTIFVITADHASSRITHDVYKTLLGDFRVPILIYDPSGELPTGNKPGIMQHIDIMPTLLGILGYDQPYVSFGKDMLATASDSTWAMNWHNIPQYIRGDYLLQMENFEPKALYNFIEDPLLEHNIVSQDTARAKDMSLYLKAILQTYNERMDHNTLRCKD